MVDIHRWDKHIEAEIHANSSPDAKRLTYLMTLNENGCLMRGIESAFRVEAGISQWEEWVHALQQAMDLGESLRRSGISGNRIRTLTANLVAKFVTCYLRESRTPIGEALRNRNVYRGAYSFSQLKERMDSGSLVIAAFAVQGAPHFAHIARFGDRVVRMSDNYEPVKYSSQRMCEAMIFTPR